MKNSTLKILTLVLLVLGFSALGACQSKTENKPKAEQTAEPQPAKYSADLQKLKDDFNADKDKVRLLLILSPT